MFRNEKMFKLRRFLADYKKECIMQLIVLYILWRFTKAILVGWSKETSHRDR